MTTIYDGFDIESFEAGKGLWHARIRRSDFSPVAIDGVLFPAMEVGFAWPDPDAAIADAKHHPEILDREAGRWTLDWLERLSRPLGTTFEPRGEAVAPVALRPPSTLRAVRR